MVALDQASPAPPATLVARRLPAPRLSFDAHYRMQRDTNAYQGLVRFGPYDQGLPTRQTDLRPLLIHPRDQEQLASAFARALEYGLLQFRGMGSLFRGVRFVDQGERRCVVEADASMPLGDAARTYRQAVERHLSRDADYDIAYIIDYGRRGRGVEPDPYGEVKALLAAHGIPSQVLSVGLLSDQRTLSHALPNIALATYAKVGNTPWALVADSDASELIVGLARADYGRRLGRSDRVMGLCTLFRYNGAFVYWEGLQGSAQWDEYPGALQRLIVSAVREYEAAGHEAPRRLTFHVSGMRPGRVEPAAIADALGELGLKCEVAVIHIDDSSLFWLMDGADASCLPETGLAVQLSPRDFVLVAEGRHDGGVALPRRPLRVTIDGDLTTVPADQFPELVEKVFYLTRMNWRGFRARSVPVSVYYPQLIARYALAFQRQQLWAPITKNVTLRRRKAWFL